MFCDIKYQPIREGNMYIAVEWNINLSTLLFALDRYIFIFSRSYIFWHMELVFRNA